MSIKEPSVTIRDLLQSEWDNSNTSIDEDPKIHTGWFNGSPGWIDNAQITITTPRDNILSGGETGFTGTKADGSGGFKVILGNVTVGCWAHHGMYDNVNAKTLAFELSEEVERIITDNTFDNTDLNWISWVGRAKRVDTNADPTLFRQDCRVRYSYTKS